MKKLALSVNQSVGYGPHRSESSKWRVTFKEYPHEKYPDFCLGSSGSILNRKAVSLLLAQINRTPFLWLEDVFTIGLLRANAGIKITSLEAKKKPDRSDKSQTETDSRNLGPSEGVP